MRTASFVYAGVQKGEGGVQGMPLALTLFSSFSSQNEGTRLQKDLRTYLASVKGEGQTWPGWAGLHRMKGGALPMCD